MPQRYNFVSTGPNVSYDFGDFARKSGTKRGSCPTHCGGRLGYPAYPPDSVRPVAQAVQKHWNRRCHPADTDGSNIEKLF